MEKDNLITETSEKYPFLTGITYAGQEYVGDSRQLQNINIFMKDKLAGLEKGLEAMNGKN